MSFFEFDLKKKFFFFFLFVFSFSSLSGNPLWSAYLSGLSGYQFSTLGSERYPSLSSTTPNHSLIFSQHFLLPINYTTVLEYSYHFPKAFLILPLTLKGISSYEVYVDNYSEYDFSAEDNFVNLNIFLQTI